MGSGGQLGLYSEYFPEEEMGRREYGGGGKWFYTNTTDMEVKNVRTAPLFDMLKLSKF